MPDRPPPAEDTCRPTPLATMAEEERRYDSLPPHLWRTPATPSDLARKIATVESRLAAIDRRIAGGTDLAYWQDCRALAITRAANASFTAAP